MISEIKFGTPLTDAGAVKERAKTDEPKPTEISTNDQVVIGGEQAQPAPVMQHKPCFGKKLISALARTAVGATVGFVAGTVAGLAGGLIGGICGLAGGAGLGFNAGKTLSMKIATSVGQGHANPVAGGIAALTLPVILAGAGAVSGAIAGAALGALGMPIAGAVVGGCGSGLSELLK